MVWGLTGSRLVREEPYGSRNAPPGCPRQRTLPEVWGGAQVWGYTGNRSTYADAMTIKRKPASHFFGKVVTVECWVLVCGACGFTELYNQAPQTLLGEQ